MGQELDRRVFLKKSIQTGIAAFSIGVSGRFYCKHVEPFWVETKAYKINIPSIPPAFHKLRIVQFSDTHLGFHFNLLQLTKMIDKINKLQPDLILFTGDLLDKPAQYKNKEALAIVEVLSKIKAAHGKFCCYGNHDHGHNGSSLYKEVMEASDFIVLRNSNRMLRAANGQSIYIAGIDEPMIGRPLWDKTLENIPDNQFVLLLSHAPDLAHQAKNLRVDMQLSGHSHGGQIQLPFIGPIFTPPFAKDFSDGLYNAGRMIVYVNKGLGTTRIPYRFLARPELTLFVLESGQLGDQKVQNNK
ncbi:metallophosphoesterase [Bacillus testis]|uniref:metallophosphoesterase n=1 Tax=Bacillus testis TaxID=1622072 RepID=UPI00067EC06C|nr:metallophosphoesterase [Bacillus testis]